MAPIEFMFILDSKNRDKPGNHHVSKKINNKKRHFVGFQSIRATYSKCVEGYHLLKL